MSTEPREQPDVSPCMYLSADVAEEVLYVFPDEEVLHDGLPVVLQDQLELVDVVVLVRGYEIRHCHDFRVVFVRLRLLKEVPCVCVCIFAILIWGSICYALYLLSI